MPPRHSLPDLWLLSDARNDARLEQALERLPGGSGFVFRHYHLPDERRRARYDTLAKLCRAHDHLVVLSGESGAALEWSADGVYAAPAALRENEGLLRFATVHDAHEIALANGAGVDAMFLSPVFPTRSHPGEQCLGERKFLELAARAKAPVIALGGMNAKRAADLGWPRWAAVDGLS